MKRLQAITDALDSLGVDAMLITELKNVRYLSGFTGSSACLMITKEKRVFFTDFRYQEQAGKETRGLEIVIEKEERPKLIVREARTLGVGVLGFESTVSYSFYRALLRKGFRTKAVTNVVEDIRRTKDRMELKLIGEAIRRAEKAFIDIRPSIRKGISERMIASMLEERLRKNGCRTLPFDIIVASGPNSSMPHARPTENRLRAGDLVVIDWGGEAGGYFSDMTRTLLVKGSDVSKKKEIYDTVLLANREAIRYVREGVHARHIDKTARDVIKKAGYEDFFGHGTGHGVGLDVHELPRISRLARETVKSGMVFTVEPGIYLPGIGGVRIEDMVVAGRKGCRVLTSLPKRLEIIH
ncbi:MAG: Xaa-Pro peptidase family protein [Candidatus Sulfobium sp.]|jgi:Xaa-Pro aminopeptidase